LKKGRCNFNNRHRPFEQMFVSLLIFRFGGKPEGFTHHAADPDQGGYCRFIVLLMETFRLSPVQHLGSFLIHEGVNEFPADSTEDDIVVGYLPLSYQI